MDQMKKSSTILLISFLAVFLAFGSAMALNVDFTDDHYELALYDQDLQSFHSDRDNLTLNAYPTDGAYLTWYADDGIGGGGTAGYEEDEWEFNLDEGELWGDALNISFDTSVLLTEIYLTDFFYEQRQGHFYAECGFVAFLDDNEERVGNDFYYFSQNNFSMLPSPTSNGEYTIDVSSFIGPNAYVKDVYLAGIGYNLFSESIREDHEFAVAGLNTNPVPEPATMLLFGTGLIGLAGIGRKKFFK